MIRYDNTDHKNDVTRIGWQDLIKDKLDKNDGYKRKNNPITLKYYRTSVGRFNK